MSFYVSTATFCLLHCDEWDRVVALPRHKFVTGATLLQLGTTLNNVSLTSLRGFIGSIPLMVHYQSPESIIQQVDRALVLAWFIRYISV